MPPTRPPSSTPQSKIQNQNSKIKNPLTQSFDTIPHQPLQWLWHPYLPLGKITLLLGDNDTGKSLLALHLAAQLSNNLPIAHVPNQNSKIENQKSLSPAPAPAHTLLLASEDEGPADTLRPRLDAAHAHLPHIHRLLDLHSLIPPPKLKSHASPEHPLARLESALEQNPNIKLLIIDSLPAFLGQADRLNPSAALNPAIPRTILASLSALADQHQIAILAITRLTKSPSPKLLHRAAGSHAFSFRARSALLLSTDPENPASNRRLLIPLKHTLTEPPPVRAFTITREPNAPAPSITWESLPIPLAPHEISQLAPPDTHRDTLLDSATEWLLSALADGPLTASRITALAAANGISPRTLARAKAHSTILSIKEGNRDQWWWKLLTDPSPIPPPPRTAQERLEQEMQKMLAAFQ